MEEKVLGFKRFMQCFSTMKDDDIDIYIKDNKENLARIDRGLRKMACKKESGKKELI